MMHSEASEVCFPLSCSTGKQRDYESGLDNFGARYFGGGNNLGRFMTPDPLLNSGHPDNPQSWNRYTYALNNPLTITDPTGLYNLVNTCDSDDKKCNKRFTQHAKDLKQGLSDLQKKVDSMKEGAEKTRLENALQSMGTENDNNNVNVNFAALSGPAAGETQTVADENGNVSFNVTFDPSKITGGTNDWAIDAAHEGTHVNDISNPLFSNGATTLSPFQQEYRGYQTSAWAAGALGLPNLAFGGNVIWNRSWATVDDKVLTRYITGFRDPKTGQQTHPETNPHNPWSN
jgi:RHS repeat-associated protein